MDKPVIKNITIKWEVDPDCPYEPNTYEEELADLQRYADSDPEARERIVKQYGSVEALAEQYVAENKARYRELVAGGWYYMGCMAEAEVVYKEGPRSWRSEELSSGGLWGIESDSDDEYLDTVEQEQLADLKQHLEHFCVDTSNFDELAAQKNRTGYR